jgi:DUF1009 family protein
MRHRGWSTEMIQRVAWDNPLAVEAFEGTNEAIKREARLAVVGRLW